MTARTTNVLAAAFVATAWLGALSAQTDQARERDPNWTAPSKQAERPNPLADRADLAAGGRKVFAQRCNTCHGDDGRGTTRAPNLVTADVQAQTDGTLFWKVTGGNTRGGMPSFSFLPEAQRWQLVLHLRGLARDQP
jgi:mono/diheme cytochrome c family protein